MSLFAVGSLGRALRHAALVDRRVRVAWSGFLPAIYAWSKPLFHDVIIVAPRY